MFAYDSFDSKVQKFIEPSGSEIPYDAQLWKNMEKSGNCYAYAFNMTDLNNPSPSPINAYGIDHNMIEDYTTNPDVITTCVELESKKLGFYFKKLNGKNDPIENGHYKVALALADGSDYHWYRQNPDGTWSQKSGGDDVNPGDYDGNFILDPENINNPTALFHGRNDYFCYSHFVGYFEVSPLSGKYEFDRWGLRDDKLWYLADDGLLTSREYDGATPEKIYPIEA